MSQEFNNENSESVSPSYIDPFDIWRGPIIRHSVAQMSNQFLDFMTNYLMPEEDMTGDSNNTNTSMRNEILDEAMASFEASEDDSSLLDESFLDGEETDDEEPIQLMEWQIQELPIHKCTEEEAKDEMCVICIIDFEKDDILRKLPCKHKFHTGCIDQWLTRNSKCPICRAETLDNLLRF